MRSQFIPAGKALQTIFAPVNPADVVVGVVVVADVSTLLACHPDIMDALQVGEDLTWVEEIISTDLTDEGGPAAVVDQVDLHLPGFVELLLAVEALKLTPDIVKQQVHFQSLLRLKCLLAHRKGILFLQVFISPVLLQVDSPGKLLVAVHTPLFLFAFSASAHFFGGINFCVFHHFARQLM